MEGGDQIFREVRHGESNGIHLIRQQKGEPNWEEEGKQLDTGKGQS